MGSIAEESAGIDRHAPSVRVAGALLALALGVLLYLVFRSEDLWVFRWVRELGLEPALRGARLLGLGWKRSLPEALWLTVPHSLWCYSLLEIVALLWDRAKDARRAILLTAGAVVALELSELLVPGTGTFAGADILGIVVVTVLVLLLERIRR